MVFLTDILTNNPVILDQYNMSALTQQSQYDILWKYRVLPYFAPESIDCGENRLVMVTSCERYAMTAAATPLHPRKKHGTPTWAVTELPSDVPEGPEPKWYGIAILEGVRGPGAHCMKKW